MGGRVDPSDEWWLKTPAPNMRDCNGKASGLKPLNPKPQTPNPKL